LGGEKLNTGRFHIPAAFLAAVLTIITIPAYAQNAGSSAAVNSAAPGTSADTSAPGAAAQSTAADAAAADTTTADTTVISEDSIILGESPVSTGTAAGGASVWIVVRMVIVLALAALAIYGVVFFIKRASKPPQAKDPNLKVLASIPLGTDSFAAVIGVGTKAWLVGGGSGAGLSLIAEINDQESVETMMLDDARKNNDTGTGRILDFRALLDRFKTNAGRGNALHAEASHAESLRKQRERLRGL